MLFAKCRSFWIGFNVLILKKSVGYGFILSVAALFLWRRFYACNTGISQDGINDKIWYGSSAYDRLHRYLITNPHFRSRMPISRVSFYTNEFDLRFKNHFVYKYIQYVNIQYKYIQCYARVATNPLMQIRADSRFAPSQWETSLQSNTISHWLGTNLESAL